MTAEDVPFMNYRVTACPKCERTLLLQSDLEEQVVSVKCGCGQTVMQWVTGGYKDAALIWDEEEI
jgi:hypothetical protein